MSDPNVIAMKVLEGETLSEQDRSMLTPALLAQLAIGGFLTLTDHERQQLPATLLANLALCSGLELSRTERDRLPVNLLAQLIIGGKTKADPDELERFSGAVRTIIDQC